MVSWQSVRDIHVLGGHARYVECGILESTMSPCHVILVCDMHALPVHACQALGDMSACALRLCYSMRDKLACGIQPFFNVNDMRTSALPNAFNGCMKCLHDACTYVHLSCTAAKSHVTAFPGRILMS